MWVKPTDIMLPVIRRNDREDKFQSVEIADLTFLTIDSQTESVLKCRMYTAQWAPLSGRTGSHTQKFALVVRPKGSETQLSLISNDPKNPAPMSGLTIESRTPGDPDVDDNTRKEQEKKSAVLLGKTDWKGTIDIRPTKDRSVRLIYVKNGKQELKMIPVMPGLFDSITAAVVDDKARVLAEGIANGWKNRILDYVAQRAILKAHINMAMDKDDFAKARKIYEDEYNKLDTLGDLTLRLMQTKEQLLAPKMPMKSNGIELTICSQLCTA